MSFSDRLFAYGPFPPHYVPRQYIEDYFSHHKTDSFLVLNTTLEDLTKLPPAEKGGLDRWKLTLRKYDALRHLDIWWEEEFDAVIIATGHYSVPYVRPLSLLNWEPFHQSQYLNFSNLGTLRQRPRRIHSQIPQPRDPLQAVPLPPDLHLQARTRNRKLRLRARHSRRTGVHGPAAGLSIPPFPQPMGR